jgi:hypothetical protein
MPQNHSAQFSQACKKFSAPFSALGNDYELSSEKPRNFGSPLAQPLRFPSNETFSVGVIGRARRIFLEEN